MTGSPDGSWRIAASRRSRAAIEWLQFTKHRGLEGIASTATVGKPEDHGLRCVDLRPYRTGDIATDVFHHGLRKTHADLEHETDSRVD